MASLLFLQLIDKGGSLVKGEVEAEGHAHWIQLEGCSWDMSQRDDPHGAVPGKAANYAKPKTFNFSKAPDSSTTRMMQAQVEDLLFQRADFHLFEELEGSDDDTGGIFDLTITLTDVRIKSYKLTANSDDKSVTMKEEWELDYGDITFKHKNAGANVTIEKPAEPPTPAGKGKSGTSGAPGASGGQAGGQAAGNDFLTPLGSF
ncbi:type VI secretion system tube protein Hcp [Pseudorhodoferax sp. Leaf274]|uniref:type VI secretion system tube protein Hcp n=1 Tax=Pseudorhodoferax sp. Leaf274 TaxID=1736318 RepID=UPI000703C271|nr:type VI secretion system tube protein Hcp [Pseudorhodoferax sp. Leaf274]KQP35442.1 hypothetical protein ASF44_19045 [Pseudorhodoferax sp. Leaf274]